MCAASQEALEKQRSSQLQVEYQLGVRQQELDEKTAALEEKAKRHAIELVGGWGRQDRGARGLDGVGD